MQLILASQSFQRKKILHEMGLNFEVLPAHIDEHHAGFVRPHSIVQSIALRKAQAIAEKHSDRWIIAADTIVILANGEIALKPESEEEAIEVIKNYRNSFCHVYSGLVVLNEARKACLKGYEKSTIKFGNFSDEQIENYLKIGKWQSSSGSLTIEEVGSWIKKIEGDYSNILGLPVFLLKEFLEKIGQ